MNNPLCLRLMGCLLLLATPSMAFEKTLYFPPATEAWEQVKPAQVGWNVDRLKDAINYAGEQKSSGVVILYQGRILLEKYWPLDPPAKDANGRPNRYFHMRVGKNAQGRAIEDVASAQKSVTAMLVGIAQHKGLLEIEDPVHKHLGKGWSRAPAKAEARRHRREVAAAKKAEAKKKAAEAKAEAEAAAVAAAAASSFCFEH